MGTAADSLRLYRFERTVSENMGEIYPPDNSLPQKREEAEIFHAHAYRLAVKCYQPQIPFSILPKEPSLEQYSRLSYDPELMYRPDSVPFYLSQPSGMPEELTYREAVRSEKSPLTRGRAGI